MTLSTYICLSGRTIHRGSALYQWSACGFFAYFDAMLRWRVDAEVMMRTESTCGQLDSGAVSAQTHASLKRTRGVLLDGVLQRWHGICATAQGVWVQPIACSGVGAGHDRFIGHARLIRRPGSSRAVSVE